MRWIKRENVKVDRVAFSCGDHDREPIVMHTVLLGFFIAAIGATTLWREPADAGFQASAWRRPFCFTVLIFAR